MTTKDDAKFLLEAATIEIDGTEQIIEFLGGGVDLDKTHVTIIAGANGTNKSRILASIVDEICVASDSDGGFDLRKRDPAKLRTTSMKTVVGGRLPSRVGTIQTKSKDWLPTRVLALSNLVMDKFRFPEKANSDGAFYRYLGVRQASNLTTTGSLEKSVGEAILSVIAHPEKLALVKGWMALILPDADEIMLSFSNLSGAKIARYQDVALIRDRLRRGAAEKGRAEETDIEAASETILRFLNFLREHQTEEVGPGGPDKKRRQMLIPIERLSGASRSELHSLAPALPLMSLAGLSGTPKVWACGSSWIPFDQLSSGEQNILSNGSKLIANAIPGCLVVIDEPEVSLNVAWQQRYVDLLVQSMSAAPGSHVLVATHSPHLISSLPQGQGSVVLIQRNHGGMRVRTTDATFEGWGSEAILYEVLDIPSTSNFHFNRELAAILRHLQDGGRDTALIDGFIDKLERLDFSDVEPLGEVRDEIIAYRKELP
ncbi:AAA family ATPase [Rhizobium phaseoli]|uniref:AAA family ATPase n=1 Tax=Rhizobium phaseoli TaxID=396 RepID=UPI0007EB3C55|nr:AAA family ATPase [Rhizobium phaseoli]ANL33929.1 AAA domain-containing protein [Rhizobium phaseoli]ANL97654.1 AAA domain-containing protein [Rhizobium phaseoli]